MYNNISRTLKSTSKKKKNLFKYINSSLVNYLFKLQINYMELPSYFILFYFICHNAFLETEL